jgi:hypothetical protein
LRRNFGDLGEKQMKRTAALKGDGGVDLEELDDPLAKPLAALAELQSCLLSVQSLSLNSLRTPFFPGCLPKLSSLPLKAVFPLS